MSGRKFKSGRKDGKPSKKDNRSKDEPPPIKTFKSQFGKSVIPPNVMGALATEVTTPDWGIDGTALAIWAIKGHPYPLDELMRDADYLIQLADKERKEALNPVYIWDYMHSADLDDHIRSIYDENDSPARDRRRLYELINNAKIVNDEEKDITIPRINAIDFFLGKDFDKYFKDPNYRETVEKKRNELKKWYDANKSDMEKASNISNENYGIAYYCANREIDEHTIKQKDMDKYRIDNNSMGKDGWKKDFIDYINKETQEKKKPKKSDYVLMPYKPVYVEYWQKMRNWLEDHPQYKKQ
jgi:hypothetical protein